MRIFRWATWRSTNPGCLERPCSLPTDRHSIPLSPLSREEIVKESPIS
jgi:hypothetical protein